MLVVPLRFPNYEKVNKIKAAFRDWIRLRINRKFNDFISGKPDIFVFGEAGTSTCRSLILQDYSLIFHPGKTTEQMFRRRGLVVFYPEKHKQQISRPESSSQFDF